MSKKQIDFKTISIRLEVSHRGGGVEIALDTLGYPDERMTAYQNYLGDGMLGSIQNDCTISDFRSNKKLSSIANQLAEYFHNLTNHSEDEFESATFEENQKRPVNAY